MTARDHDLPLDVGGMRVIVAGLEESGFSEADVLLDRGAQVTVIEIEESEAVVARAALLRELGAEIAFGVSGMSVDCDMVVVGSDWTPNALIFHQAVERRIPVLSDLELARRLNPARPWLGVAGPRSVDAALILEQILHEAGHRVSAVGKGIRPILETELDGIAYDCLAVSMAGQQLRWTSNLHMHSSVVLGIDDADPWYALSPSNDARASLDSQRADLAKAYYQTQVIAMYNVDVPMTETMLSEADVAEGVRAVGVTTSIPSVSMLGVVDGLIVDRAFIPQRWDSALELMRIMELGEVGPSVVTTVLAAAGLARSFGVGARHVRDGVRKYMQSGRQENHGND